MRESLRLGRIAGVNVGINWSVLVIVALIAFGLAAGRLPATAPGLSAEAYAAAGVVAAVLFLASLLAHEVAHAVVAQRNGIEVEGITLWLFGGVARLTGEPDSPAVDLRVAGVGPLTSVVLAAAFFALGRVGDGLGLAAVAVQTLDWLALINAVLAVFNVVPAAPLDGGRILRAFLWWRHGDRTRAAVTAAKAGRGFGFLLVALGLAQIVAVPGLGGLWTVLIGWFLANAAGVEQQHARLREALAGTRVRDVMSSDVVSVPASASVATFLDDYVLRHRFTAFPVVAEDGGVGGLVTLNRVREVPPDARGQTSIRQVASPVEEVTTVRADEPLADVVPRLLADSDSRLLVVEDGRVVGIVTSRDLLTELQLAEFRDPDLSGRV